MKRIIGGAAALLLLQAGCGSGDKAAVSCTASSSAATQIGRQLNSGATVAGQAQAVRSPEFQHVYIVAVKLTGPGIDNQPAVFALNDLSAATTILAVDAMAREFSDWPDGTAQGLSVTSSGVKDATSCL